MFNRNLLQLFLPFILLTVFFDGCTLAEDHTSPPRQNLLLISFDGFRYDFTGLADTPAFDSLARNGVVAEGLIPVNPTKTFPNHYTMATGLYPEHHGLVANTMYDTLWDKWYRISNREAVMNGDWYEGEPIWNTAMKQGLNTGTMFWIGSEADIQGMHPDYWKVFDEDMPEKARIDTVVKWFSYGDDRSIQFGTLYFEFVDDAGHDYGLHSDSLAAAVKKADNLLQYLDKRLREKGLYNNMNIIVVSDHGLAELSQDKIIMLDSIVDMEDIERIAWAPVTMIQPAAGKEEEIYRALKEFNGPYTVYRKNNLPERFHLDDHRRVPEILLVANLGYTIMDQRYKTRFLQSLPSANHGFDNIHREMRGYFAARGPAIADGDTVLAFQNIHLYELMNRILGTRPAANDGSIDSVGMILK